MKVGFIVVLYKTPKIEIIRLTKEIKNLEIRKYRLIFIDNTNSNLGYGDGINKGIRKLKSYKPDIFIFLNDDISLKNINKQELFEAYDEFDIWGYAFRQNKKIFYGGEIDKKRATGGLITKKPKFRFVNTEFVSGSFMCVKKLVIQELKFIDPSYFMYYEDVDFCTRAIKKGFKVGIDHKILYDHYENKNRNPLKEYFIKNSRLKYLLKHGTFYQKFYEILRAPKTLFENKEGFLFNFFSLNTSTLVNKIINFVLFIVLIKFFNVENYGIYTLVWAHINVFSPLTDLGTTSYGLLKIDNLFNSKISTLYSLRVTAALIGIFSAIIFSFIFRLEPLVIGFIFLTSPIILSNAMSGSYLIILAIKNKQYLSSIFSVSFNLILLITLSFVLFSFKSLIILFFAIFLLYILYSYINLILIKKIMPTISFSFDLKKYKKIIYNSFIFILISFLAGLYFRIDVYLLNFLINKQAVGIYSAGYKFFEALIFIAASYSFAMLPTLRNIFSISKKEFIKKIKIDSFIFLALGSFLSLALFFISPYFLSYFLKGSYIFSIDVFRIVIFALPFIFSTTVFLNGLYILNKANFVAFIFLFQVLLNFFLNYKLIPKYSYIASSYITVGAELLTLVLSMMLFTKFAKSRL